MKQSTSAMSRRTLFAGAGTVGALAAAVTLLPSVREVAPAETRQEPPTRGGGYQLSEHVQRYFKTTRI